MGGYTGYRLAELIRFRLLAHGVRDTHETLGDAPPPDERRTGSLP
jgi:hypothetical protein